MAEKVPDPSRPGLAWERQEPAVTICRDLMGGTLAVRAKDTDYLPQLAREEDDDYADRLNQSVLYNALRRTVKGLVGMVFRKDPQLSEDVPEEIVEHAENIDLAGRHLSVFARDLCENAIIDGHAHVLVEFPRVGESVRTLADEREAGLRPYWVALKKLDVLHFRTEQRGGETVLTQFGYRETVTVPDGEFAEVEVERVRVYRLSEQGVVVDIWEKTEDDEPAKITWRIIESARLSIDEIPLVTVYAGERVGFMESVPPLEDLAHENLRHYRIRSERDKSMQIASVPVPVITGITSEEALTVGANWAIVITDTDGSASYMEPKGVALEAGRQDLRDSEQLMAALGLALLQRDTRAAETAEARRIDKSESDSALGGIARNLQDALEEALRLHAKWMRLEQGGSVIVNRDFLDIQMDPLMVQTLSALVGSGQLSIETMWQALVEGEVLPADFDPDVERERIESGEVAMLPALDALLAGAQQDEDSEEAAA